MVFNILVSPKQDMSLVDMNICKRIQPTNAPSSQIRECHCDGPCGKIKVSFIAYIHFAECFKQSGKLIT